LDHIHAQDLDRVRAMADDVAAGRLQQYEAEYRMRCDDGHYIWVLDRARVQSRLADGRAESLVGFIIDVTERRAEREALAVSEERFRSAALAARGMIYEVHYPLSENGARISARFGLEATLGYQDDEVPLTHEAWLALLHPDDIARFRAARPLDRTSGCAADLEYRVRHKSGHWVRLCDRGITLTGDDGRPSRRVGFLQSVDAESDGLLEDATELSGNEALSA
jgi:PAS domain-containing protein